MATTAVSAAAELDEQRLAARYGVRWWMARSDELLDDLEGLNVAGERDLPQALRDQLDALGRDLLRLTREAKRPDRPEPFAGASVTEALDHVFDDLQELALDMLQPERDLEPDYSEADLVLWAQVCRAPAPMPARTARDNDAAVAPPMLELQAAGNTYDGASGAGNDYIRIRPADGHPLWTQPGRAQTGIAQAPDAFVSAYYGNAVNRRADEPMPTVTAVEGHSIVEGPAVAVEDCFFRMLMPREIGLGMAFPEGYQVAGRQQRWVVRQYGLAVTPPVATWIWQRVIESLR